MNSFLSYGKSMVVIGNGSANEPYIAAGSDLSCFMRAIVDEQK
jgi:hypothetical protein